VFRTTDIVLIAVMVGAAAVTYRIKQGAENELEHIDKIKTQIRLEHDTIDVLKADWSILIQPRRLEKLANLYQAQLQLQPTTAEQIVTIDQLPMRPVVLPGSGSDASGEVAAIIKDNTVTGSVKAGSVKK
jgi:cell division protein FtsL